MSKIIFKIKIPVLDCKNTAPANADNNSEKASIVNSSEKSAATINHFSLNNFDQIPAPSDATPMPEGGVSCMPSMSSTENGRMDVVEAVVGSLFNEVDICMANNCDYVTTERKVIEKFGALLRQILNGRVEDSDAISMD